MLAIKATTRLSTIINSCRVFLNPNRSLPTILQCDGIKTLEERIGLPPKPKKPLTPYFRYMKEIRPSIASQNPKASLIEIVKLVAKKWENVDDSTKKKFEEEYKKDQEAYIQKRAQYENKLTDDQKADLKHLKQEISEAKERRVARKKVKELGKPKRPGSAFLKYLAEERTKTPQGNLTYRQWQQKIAEKWKALPDKEKNTFNRQFSADLEKYKNDMSKWEEKMVRLGHIDVVRHEALIETPPAKPRRKNITRE